MDHASPVGDAAPTPGAESSGAGRPVRVLHLLKHAQRGNGSVHVAVDLACAQADSGMEVWFAAARGSYDDLLRAHGVRVEPLPALAGATAAPRLAAAVAGVVRRADADIVHAHMMSSAALAWPLTLVGGATLVTTMHNSFDRHSWMMRAGRRIVAVSEAERELLLSRRYRESRVTVVLNGTVGSPRNDLPREDIDELRTPAVLVLTGLHPRKAVDDVIRAFGLVTEDFPDWHLNIVGWGPARDALMQQVRDSGLDSTVHFLGSTLTPQRELERAEIFVSASLTDPCPLNILEARGAGCAIVATAVGGIPEELAHGDAGQLVPPRDPEAIAAALRTLMSDPDALASWQARALHGSEWFSTARMARDYEAVYREAMPARRRRRLTPAAPRHATTGVAATHHAASTRGAGISH